jgi:hypothetical protein
LPEGIAMNRFLVIILCAVCVSAKAMDQVVFWIIEHDYTEALLCFLRARVIPKKVLLNCFEYAKKSSTQVRNLLLSYGSNPLTKNLLWGRPYSLQSGLFDIDDIVLSFWCKNNSVMNNCDTTYESMTKLLYFYNNDFNETKWVKTALYSCLWCTLREQHEESFGIVYQAVKTIGLVPDFESTLIYPEDKNIYDHYSKRYIRLYCGISWLLRNQKLHDVAFAWR